MKQNNEVGAKLFMVLTDIPEADDSGIYVYCFL